MNTTNMVNRIGNALEEALANIRKQFGWAGEWAGVDCDDGDGGCVVFYGALERGNFSFCVGGRIARIFEVQL